MRGRRLIAVTDPFLANPPDYRRRLLVGKGIIKTTADGRTQIYNICIRDFSQNNHRNYNIAVTVWLNCQWMGIIQTHLPMRGCGWCPCPPVIFALFGTKNSYISTIRISRTKVSIRSITWKNSMTTRTHLQGFTTTMTECDIQRLHV